MKTTKKIRRLEIKADRFPWQAGYSWHGMTNSTAPLNQPRSGEKAAPRFGGGWKYKIGISTGGFYKTGCTIIIDCFFGSIRITYRTKHGVEREETLERDRLAFLDRLAASRKGGDI